MQAIECMYMYMYSCCKTKQGPDSDRCLSRYWQVSITVLAGVCHGTGRCVMALTFDLYKMATCKQIDTHLRDKQFEATLGCLACRLRPANGLRLVNCPMISAVVITIQCFDGNAEGGGG